MEVDQIEQKLYMTLVPGGSAIKTALLLVRAFPDQELPDETLIDEALKLLKMRGDVQAAGVVENWRQSEFTRS